jgi:hypothetical protein
LSTGSALAAGAHGGEDVARQGCSGDRAQQQSGAVVLGEAGDESNAGAGGHQRGNGGPVVDGMADLRGGASRCAHRARYRAAAAGRSPDHPRLVGQLNQSHLDHGHGQVGGCGAQAGATASELIGVLQGIPLR